MDIPIDRKYQETHEWIMFDDKVVTIGITNYAQESLGEIVFIELPQKGDEISKGDEIAAIESVKAASSIYAPVSGIIAEVNTELEGTPEIINHDAYNTYIVKIKISGEADQNGLLDASEYGALVEEESG